MIPGINLLSIALTAIAAQSGQWIKFLGNTTNDRGQDIPTYAEPAPIVGSFQATDVRTIQAMGLDMTKQYRTLYTSNNVQTVDRGTSPDLLIFYGRKYQVAGEADWFNQDGRKALILVDIGASE